jgi:hypothetical protein
MTAEENPLDTLAQVSFRIKTVGLALAFVVLLTLLFHYGDMRTQETLKFFVPVGALAGGALSVRYAWLGLRTGLEQRQRARTEQKIAMALTFVQRWNDPNLAKLRKDWRELIDGMLADPSGVPALLKGDMEKRTVVADVLNFFEEMAYACRSGAADLTTLRTVFNFVALKYYRTARPWIEFRRKEESAQAWAEFEWLCDQWK